MFWILVWIMTERERDVLLNKPMVHFKGENIWKTHETSEKDASKTNENAMHTKKIILIRSFFVRSFHSSLIHFKFGNCINKLPSLSLNHIIHRLAYKVSQTLSQYTNQSVIIDFGQLNLKFARSVYPKSANQKSIHPSSHTFACSVSHSLIRHPLTWCIKRANYQSYCTFTHSVY